MKELDNLKKKYLISNNLINQTKESKKTKLLLKRIINIELF
jgi:hypothetical protein